MKLLRDFIALSGTRELINKVQNLSDDVLVSLASDELIDMKVEDFFHDCAATIDI